MTSVMKKKVTIAFCRRHQATAISQHLRPAGIVPASIILSCLLSVSAVCAAALSELRHLPKDTQVLVISEPFNPKSRSFPRDKQIENHEIAPEIVEEELRKAGFEILFRDDAFIETRESIAESILVARRPQ